MPFIRYTAKKILMITALSNTLAPMVKTYIRAGVSIKRRYGSALNQQKKERDFVRIAKAFQSRS